MFLFNNQSHQTVLNVYSNSIQWPILSL